MDIRDNGVIRASEIGLELIGGRRRDYARVCKIMAVALCALAFVTAGSVVLSWNGRHTSSLSFEDALYFSEHGESAEIKRLAKYRLMRTATEAIDSIGMATGEAEHDQHLRQWLSSIAVQAQHAADAVR